MPDPVAPSGYQLQETVNPETLQFTRAVKNADQAYEICKRLDYDNRKRNQNAAAIMRKYNDEQPWNPSQLAAAGQSWRKNHSTGFFSGIIKRILPAPAQIIDSARVLTSSCFQSANGVDTENDQKVEDFRVEITKTIRRWNNFNNFKNQIILEDWLMGWGTACYTDPWEWKPRFARTDEALFPDGCPQESHLVPLWKLRQNFLVHELAEKLKNPEDSKDVGWFIDNLVKSINSAMPENRRKTTVNDYRKFEDTVREATIGRSYSEGVKVIEADHLFVKEPTGMVSHFILNSKNGDPLFINLDRFDSMETVLALFSVDIGNGKLHGSKGAGRVIYNTSVAAEQSRNLYADNLSLSGMLILRGSTKGQKAVAMTVNHPFCVLGEGFEVVDHKFEVDSEAFMALDRHYTAIAEQQVGAFLPSNNPDSKEETASAVNYRASIEQQIREGVLVRFYGQFQGLVYQMQKRMCSLDNILEAFKRFIDEQNKVKMVTRKMVEFYEATASYLGFKDPKTYKVEPEDYPNKEAIETCLCLLRKGLSCEEIYELAQCPPQEVTQDFQAQNAAAIDAMLARYKGDPDVRQIELKKKDISSKMGNTVADELIIPSEDNTVTAEATRTQIFENMALMQGEHVDISPRDIDLVHMDVIEKKAGQVLSSVTPQSVNKQTLGIMENVLSHFDEHLQAASGKGMKPDALKQQTIFSQTIHKLIDHAKTQMGNTQGTGLSIPPGSSPASLMASGKPPIPGRSLGKDERNDASLENSTDGGMAPRQLSAVPVPPNTPGPAGMQLTSGQVSLKPNITP